MTCPVHGGRLYGGPIVFQCGTGAGHQVRAADVDHEYHAPAVAA